MHFIRIQSKSVCTLKLSVCCCLSVWHSFSDPDSDLTYLLSTGSPDSSVLHRLQKRLKQPNFRTESHLSHAQCTHPSTAMNLPRIFAVKHRPKLGMHALWAPVCRTNVSADVRCAAERLLIRLAWNVGAHLKERFHVRILECLLHAEAQLNSIATRKAEGL